MTLKNGDDHKHRQAVVVHSPIEKQRENLELANISNTATWQAMEGNYIMNRVAESA